MRAGTAGIGDFISDEVIKTELINVTAIMDATNAMVAQCPSLPQQSIIQWNGYYSGFKDWSTRLSGCVADVFPSLDSACAGDLYNFATHWGPAWSQAEAYKKTALSWQEAVPKTCPNVTPPPTPAPPQPLPPGRNWVDDIKKAGIVVGVTAASVAGVYLAYQVGKFVLEEQAAKKAAHA